ncbi:Rhs element Vgr protein [Janthinobacterium sp. FT14W]|uniref:phage baseplate assembly protein V n=1 Tax=Janthinobacterium sp. FT14W TaxID=2654253 RepID=UPI00126593E9|nr:phage baseplate assembly protein V [Janthinobacterium sp. FT14W]KAB8051911.1 Rhs element Vgr protein [Janthinobacterium sp. FT14W]
MTTTGGVALGAVSNTEDPKGLGRIRVFLTLSGASIESDWLQVMSFFAGPGYGAFFLPKKGDSVLLAFADGNPNKPYVLGFLWNGVQKPPVEAARQQDVRMIRTQLGKTVVLDDSAQGKITIIDEKSNRIELDTANNKISISSEGDLAISAKGTLTISAAQVVLQTTDGSVKADLSAQGMQLQGAKALKLQAAMIDLN